MKNLLLACLLMFPNFALAQDYRVGDLSVAHPIAKETTPTARASAGYFIVTNNGETADRLIAVEAEFPRVMMHETVLEDDVAKMQHLDSVDIAPGESINFEPGGMHVMFMGLDEQLVEGGEFAGTLVFEKAGRLEIVFKVEKIVQNHRNH